MISIIAAMLVLGLPNPVEGVIQCESGRDIWLEAGMGCHSNPLARTVEQYWWVDAKGKPQVLENPCWFGQIPCMSASRYIARIRADTESILDGREGLIVEQGDNFRVITIRPDGLPDGAVGIPVTYCKQDHSIWAERGETCHEDSKDRQSPICGYITKDGHKSWEGTAVNNSKLLEPNLPPGIMPYAATTDNVTCRIPKGFDNTL